MLSDPEISALLDRGRVIASDGETVGRVGQVFRSDTTGEPTWVSVKTDEGDTHQTLVPLGGERIDNGDVHVDYDAATITKAPRATAGSSLSEQDEVSVRAFYDARERGLSAANSTDAVERRSAPPGSSDGVSARGSDVGQASGGLGRGADRSGAEAGRGDADDAAGPSVIRSEEQLRVDTHSKAVRRARLEKFQITDVRTIEVPVLREDVRIVYDDIGGDPSGDSGRGPGAATDGGAGLERGSGRVAAGSDTADKLRSDSADGEPASVVLYGERIVVTREWVPLETVHLDVETITEEQQFSDQVRREEIAVDSEPAGSPRESQAKQAL